MKSRPFWFNIYLLALTVVLAAGCQSGSTRKNKLSTLGLHLEVNPDGTTWNAPVPVYRAKPIYVNVENRPFLTEAHIASASVVDALGGFELQIQCNQRGTWLLEQYSTACKGRRVAVFSEFGEARWLACPLLTHRITNGVFAFTPDATREEAERIAKGLNNVAEQIRKMEF